MSLASKVSRIAVFSALALAGCQEDSGSPPSIENLEFDPDTITPNAMEVVTASFDFVDEDGDLDEVEVTLTGFGQELDLDAELTGASGMKAGRGAVLLALQAPEEGELAVSLAVVDAEGNRSGALEGTIQVALAAPPEECEEGECAQRLEAALIGN